VEEEDDDEDDEDNDNENEDDDDGKFFHPRNATAWDTKVFLLTQRLPPSEEVRGCRTEVEARGKEANNENALIEARDALYLRVQDEAKLYHYCFYIMTHKLHEDIQKERQNLRDKSLYFLGKVQELWVLARAMDMLDGKDTYFRYLQKRYIDMSQSVFGRQMSVIGRSLDQLPRPEWNRKKSIIQNDKEIEGAFGSSAETDEQEDIEEE